jgi:hypothetical protein
MTHRSTIFLKEKPIADLIGSPSVNIADLTDLGLALAELPQDVWIEKELLAFEAGMPENMVEELLPTFILAHFVEVHASKPDKVRIRSKAKRDKAIKASQSQPLDSESKDAVIKVIGRLFEQSGI